MAKLNVNSGNLDGSWFQGVTINTSFNKLKEVLGEPSWIDTSFDKIKYEWDLELDGINFSVYDWKEYFFSDDDNIDFHIGGFNKEDAEYVKGIIAREINLHDC